MYLTHTLVHIFFGDFVSRTRIYQDAEFVEYFVVVTPPVKDEPVVAAYNQLEILVRVCFGQFVQRIYGIRGAWHGQLDITGLDADDIASGIDEHLHTRGIRQYITPLFQGIER